MDQKQQIKLISDAKNNGVEDLALFFATLTPEKKNKLLEGLKMLFD